MGTPSVPADNTVYQAVWEHRSPDSLYAFTQWVNEEGQATFTFIVRADGSVAEITKEQVLPVNTNVGRLEKYLKDGLFAPVYKHGRYAMSYQSYTFYYGDSAYLQFWRETCEHEGNRNNPLPDSGIKVVYTRYCTRVQYPGFLAYRFLLWPARTACSSDPHHHCEIGWVMLSFKLNSDGHARDVTVYKSNAGDLIELAAQKAVENWYFVPTAGRKLYIKALYVVTLVYHG
ncbi:MAG: energy transducer TonB [Gammaproteobacteria bacterium]